MRISLLFEHPSEASGEPCVQPVGAEWKSDVLIPVTIDVCLRDDAFFEEALRQVCDHGLEADQAAPGQREAFDAAKLRKFLGEIRLLRSQKLPRPPRKAFV
ncbi:MAG: hypothetical protein H6Q55_1097, partial [Deltaproteobacteria bacterium]|nr:hypothetical protein [Deltaproteobacteria bacterium]